ncbi:MAG TPA: hypothetical protein VK851_03155 [Anaerolineales bacterium]|nr:hypothetical protein [Anaerolineales bacterium]
MMKTADGIHKYASRWIYAGSIVLMGLILAPTHKFVIDSGSVLLPTATPIVLVISSFPSLGLFIAAFLLYSGLNLYREYRNNDPVNDWNLYEQRKKAGRSALVSIFICVLLLAKSMHNLYWLLLWDRTADGIGSGWMVFGPLPVAFITGLMLAVALEGRQKLTGFLYLLAIPGLLIGIAAYTSRADLRQITEARAERVTRAIEAYHARHGTYPRELRYLISWSAPDLPQPAIIYGQDWCYKGREDYYTLGYVYHTDWSDPHLVGEVYKTAGDDPVPDEVCNTEIEVLRLQRYVPDIP